MGFWGKRRGWGRRYVKRKSSTNPSVTSQTKKLPQLQFSESVDPDSDSDFPDSLEDKDEPKPRAKAPQGPTVAQPIKSSSIIGRPVALNPSIAQPIMSSSNIGQPVASSSSIGQCIALSPVTSAPSTPALATSNLAIPSTSRGLQKRHLDGIKVYDNDSECESPKKFKSDNECQDDEDYEGNSEDDYMEDNYIHRLKDYDMPFPNLAEDINFDVSAIPNRPATYSYMNNLGDKGLQDFLRERALTTECIEQLYNSLIKVPKDAVEKDPVGLSTHLMPHQRQALKWMRWREEQKPSGGILADDMGLGKTIQLISLILAAKNEKNEKESVESDDDEDWGCSSSRETHNGRNLVVCPASLTQQWEREVQTKCRRGKLSVFIYHGTSRDISKKNLAKFDIVITTYNLIAQEYELYVAPKKNKDSRLFKINWERVILDEAHYIRNYKSKGSMAVCELTTKSRWALTGTPIQNKESDLYALLKFLKCSPFDEIKVWNRWVSNKNSAGNKRLIIITKSLMLRRTKTELMGMDLIEKLPNKNLDIIEVKLDPGEKVVYQKLFLYSQTFFEEFLRQKKEKEHLKEFGCHMRPSLITKAVPDKLSRLLKVLMTHHTQVEAHFILVLILRLRQICCHPVLIKSMLDKEDIDLEGNGLQTQQVNSAMVDELNYLMTDDEDEDDDDDDFKIDERLAKNVMSRTNPIFRKDRQSSKVRAVIGTIQSILDRGEKVIVVSQWTGFLEIIASYLDYIPGVKYDTFSGKVALKNRQDIVDKLNDNDDQLNVLLLSLTAGGVGLNLVGANNLLLIDLHWNPQLETHAQDRIYRFGQENNVHIYKFITKGTIEVKIKELQDRKLKIAKNVLTGTVSNKLTIEDLKLLFS